MTVDEINIEIKKLVAQHHATNFGIDQFGNKVWASWAEGKAYSPGGIQPEYFARIQALEKIKAALQTSQPGVE